MIPTPDLSHLTASDYEHIYEPAEDTFLLLDALEADEQHLRRLKPTITLEIGSGSGCVTSFLAKILGSSVRASVPRLEDDVYLCTDINPHACRCTNSTATQNTVTLDAVNAWFAAPLMVRLKHSIDVILFNPPYVPTTSDEVSDAQNTRDLKGSWAGGVSGMSVTDVFLEQVETLMSEQGRFYLVAVKENNVPEIRERMLRRYGLHSQVVLNRRAGREHLFVLRFLKGQTLNEAPVA